MGWGRVGGVGQVGKGRVVHIITIPGKGNGKLRRSGLVYSRVGKGREG